MISALISLAFAACSVAGPLTRPSRFLFVFGDSYSTTGFQINGKQPTVANPIGNPAFPGITTCNGPNWVGNLVKGLSPAGTVTYNYAFSGATVNNSIASHIVQVPSFVDQTEEFLSTVGSSPSSLNWNAGNSAFAVYFGTNDIAVTYTTHALSMQAIIDRIFDSYFNLLDKLHAAGARRFMLVGMAPYDRAPGFSGLLGGTSRSLVAKDVGLWNEKLQARATGFQKTHADAKVTILDTQAIFNPILDDPQAYGVPNARCANKDGSSCLWHDSVHPGLVIQKAIGVGAHKALSLIGFY